VVSVGVEKVRGRLCWMEVVSGGDRVSGGEDTCPKLFRGMLLIKSSSRVVREENKVDKYF